MSIYSRIEEDVYNKYIAVHPKDKTLCRIFCTPFAQTTVLKNWILLHLYYNNALYRIRIKFTFHRIRYGCELITISYRFLILFINHLKLYVIYYFTSSN